MADASARPRLSAVRNNLEDPFKAPRLSAARRATLLQQRGAGSASNAPTSNTRRMEYITSFFDAGKNFDGTAEERAALKVALAKVTHAAVRFDGSRDGVIFQNAFAGPEMDPAMFQLQLQRAFLGCTLSEVEVKQLARRFDHDGNGMISGPEFTKLFLQRSFDEKRRVLHGRDENRLDRELEMERDDAAVKLAKMQTWDAACATEFDETDKANALAKITAAARKYDKNMPDAMPLTAFEGAEMHPFVFREQLKRVFKVEFSRRELGALTQMFDLDGDGMVSCPEFLRTFFGIGFVERSRLRGARVARAGQRMEAMERFQAARLKKADARDLAKVKEYTLVELNSTVDKLIEASVKYSVKSLGPAGLRGFTSTQITPTVFREQLRRAFGIRLDFSELKACVDFIDVSGSGVVDCAAFLSKFFKIGSTARRILLEGGNDCELKFARFKQELLLKHAVDVATAQPIQQLRCASFAGGMTDDDQRPGTSGALLTSASATFAASGSPVESYAANAALQPRTARTAPLPATTGGVHHYAHDRFGRQADALFERAAQRHAPMEQVPQTASRPQTRLVLDLSAQRHAVVSDDDNPLDTALTMSSISSKMSLTPAFFTNAPLAVDLLRCAKNMPFLCELWLTNNALLGGALPEALPPLLPQLRRLGVAGVGLRHFPESLGALASLRALHADRNMLEALPIDAFRILARLQTLTLARNTFVDIPVEALRHCAALQTLDLSDNAIDSVPANVSRLRGLVELDLRGNAVEHHDVPDSGRLRVWLDDAKNRTPEDDELASMLKRRAGAPAVQK
ncbi:hypothetical protein M885DRAFT_626674 [Pelagophyceae sp. CCMP2097]|nr:hypothetical protein M885DRAFT_626674 [Pelagophyceae sp. CCMP2097]